MDITQKRYYQAGHIVFLIIITYVVLRLLAYIQNTIAIIAFSIFLAYLLLPAVRFLENPVSMRIPNKIKVAKYEVNILKEAKIITFQRTGIKRVWAILIVFLFVIAGIALFLSTVIPQIAAEFQELLNNMPTTFSNVQAKFMEYYNWIQPKLPDEASEALPQAFGRIASRIEQYLYQGISYSVTIAQAVVSFAFAAFLVPIFAFYILLDLEKIKKSFKKIIPAKKEAEILGLLRQIDDVVGRYIRGQVFVSILVGIGITLVLLIMRIDYAFLIGTISGITNFIPYLGVLISIVPSAIIALTDYGFVHMLITIAGLEGVQFLEGQVLTPNIMGEAMGLSPLVIIIVLIIGGQLLGLLGVFIAVPITAILKVIFNYYFTDTITELSNT